MTVKKDDQAEDDRAAAIAAARETWDLAGGLITDRDLRVLLKGAHALLERTERGQPLDPIDARILKCVDHSHRGRAVWPKPPSERITYTPAEAKQLAELAAADAAATGLCEMRKGAWFKLLRDADRLNALIEHAPLHEDAAGRRQIQLPKGTDVSPTALRRRAQQMVDAEKAFVEARDRAEAARGALNRFKLGVQRRWFDAQYAAEQAAVLNTPEGRRRKEAYDATTKPRVVSEPISESLL